MAGFLDTQSASNQLEAIYVAYFGRAADGGGYNYWSSHFSSPVSVANSFSVQPEAASMYTFLASPPTTLSTTDPIQIAEVDGFLNAVYQDLFGRATDSTGLSYWQGQILSGAVSVGSAVYTIANGAIGNDATTLGNKITVASFFTATTATANTPGGGAYNGEAHIVGTVTSTAASVTAAESSITSFTTSGNTSSLTLTPGADTLSTSSPGAVFSAQLVNTSTQIGAGSFNVQTLTTTDSLTDSKGDGTLDATLNGGSAANLTISGIATANVTNIGGALVLQGNISGLTTVNDSSSLSGIQMGVTGQGLATALTNVNVSTFVGPAGSVLFTGVIAAAAGSASNTINVAVGGILGSTVAADKLTFTTDGSAGTKASPNTAYGTWALTVNSAANLQLQQTVAGTGVGGATTLTLAGSGNAALGAGAATEWSKVATINASAATGNITITGAVAGALGNAAASAANPGGLFGSVAGLLSGNTALTSYSLSSGTNVLDVSSFTTAAQLAALTTTVGSTVATNNEIIVTSLNADATTTTTWANIKGFQIVGDVGAGSLAGGDNGTINLANLPSSVNEIYYQTAAAGTVNINTLPTAFTADTEANGASQALIVGASGAASGTSDTFTLIVGSNTAAVPAGAVGAVTLNGEEVVTVTAQGSSGTPNVVGTMLLAPSLTGNEHVTIGGTASIALGGGSTAGALIDATSTGAGGALNNNNLTLTVTDTGTAGTATVELHSATAAGLLDFVPAGEPAAAAALLFSTNALTIDAHTSTAGLIMDGGDGNYTVTAAAAAVPAVGSGGDVITGSATAGNVLGGSIGNDTITGNTSSTNADTIYTGGGADSITLAATHTAADHVDLYAGSTGGPAVAGAAITAIGGSIVTPADLPELGWWNQATGNAGAQSATTNLGTAAGFGTSADMSVVANFVVGTAAAPQDVVDISVGAFGATGASLLHDGLTGAALVAGTAVFSSALAAGGTVTAATGAVTASVLYLSGTFSGSAGLASSLAGAGTAIHFGVALPAAAPGVSGDHVILVYQDATSGTVHIADLDIHSTAAVTSTANGGAGAETIAVSDMVQLTGVTEAQLHQGNIHFVA